MHRHCKSGRWWVARRTKENKEHLFCFFSFVSFFFVSSSGVISCGLAGRHRRPQLKASCVLRCVLCQIGVWVIFLTTAITLGVGASRVVGGSLVPTQRYAMFFKEENTLVSIHPRSKALRRSAWGEENVMNRTISPAVRYVMLGCNEVVFLDQVQT
jgi:hypothetical protein